MDSKRIFLIFQMLYILIFGSSIICNAQELQSSDLKKDSLLAIRTDDVNISSDSDGSVIIIDEAAKEKADTLSGTCPKGFHCSCANCPLYSDLDEDILCDLGEYSEE